MLVVCCLLRFVRFVGWLFVVDRWLLVGRSLLFVMIVSVCYLLFVVGCWFFGSCAWMSVGARLLLVVGCWLLVVGCCPIVNIVSLLLMLEC